MMKLSVGLPRSRFLALSAGLAAAACAPAFAASQDEALVRELIAAINAKDDAALLRFIERRFASNVEPAQRLARMKRLGIHAPFTFVRLLGAESAQTRAIVLDGDGVQTMWTLLLDADRRITAVGVETGDDAGPPPPQIGPWTDLHSLAAQLRSASGVPAISIAAMHGGALDAATDGVRTPGGANVGPQEPWKIGSIGKPLCTSVIARLIERGVLDWTTPLGAALKGVKMPAAYAEATLEEVMHHRGGFAGDNDYSAAMVERIAAGSSDPQTIRAHYAADILSRPPALKRGEYRYSNAGYSVLGHVAELAAGKPYETLLHEEVFAPLQMSSSFTGSDALPAEHPAGHRREPSGPKPAEFKGPLEFMVAPAGGGIWMTMQDLTRFGAAHMAGLQGRDGYLKASTVARLHTGFPEPDGPLVYACGWGITQNPGIGEMHGHNGGDGTFFAHFGIFSNLNLVVASAVNEGGDNGGPTQALLAVAKRYASG